MLFCGFVINQQTEYSLPTVGIEHALRALSKKLVRDKNGVGEKYCRCDIFGMVNVVGGLQAIQYMYMPRRIDRNAHVMHGSPVVLKKDPYPMADLMRTMQPGATR